MPSSSRGTLDVMSTRIRKPTTKTSAIESLTTTVGESDGPSHVTLRQKRSAANQDAFLVAFGKCGTIAEAAEAIGLTRQAHYDWIEADTNSYRERFDAARVAFGDTLERLAWSRVSNPTGNRGSDMLVVALLNANLPSKYRPNVTVVDNTAKDLLKRLGMTGQKRIGRKQRDDDEQANEG